MKNDVFAQFFAGLLAKENNDKSYVIYPATLTKKEAKKRKTKRKIAKLSEKKNRRIK